MHIINGCCLIKSHLIVGSMKQRNKYRYVAPRKWESEIIMQMLAIIIGFALHTRIDLLI